MSISYLSLSSRSTSTRKCQFNAQQWTDQGFRSSIRRCQLFMSSKSRTSGEKNKRALKFNVKMQQWSILTSTLKSSDEYTVKSNNAVNDQLVIKDSQYYQTTHESH